MRDNGRKTQTDSSSTIGPCSHNKRSPFSYFLCGIVYILLLIPPLLFIVIPMVSCSIQVVLFTILAILIIRGIEKFRRRGMAAPKVRLFGYTSEKIFLALLLLVLYRSAILAMWMLSPLVLTLSTVALAAVSYFKKKTRADRVKLFAMLFLMLFPVYLSCAVVLFATKIGDRCGLMERERGTAPVFSMCSAKNRKLALRLTGAPYHCRSAFFSADRKLVYIGFGAETNPATQALLGVDPSNQKIRRKISDKTVFGGYCHREYRDCIFLVTPDRRIRLWDDGKHKAIRDYYLNSERARPRFFSVDQDGKTVYVATDRNWIVVVDLEKKRLINKIKVPDGSLLTITNTRKHIVASSAFFLRPFLYVVDKNSGRSERLYVGLPTIWKNLGFLFHLAADPERERVFAGAPFECAVYMIDLKTKKTVWRYPLPIGIRSITFDTKRRTLYAANYVDGYVYKIDAAGDEPRYLGKIFIGRRIRFFNYEKDEDVFLAASANGFFIYKPGALGFKSQH
jgi:hypothetical protein